MGYLVISRKRGQEVEIKAPNGDRIRVAVMRTQPDKRQEMRIGIDAPKSYEIHRVDERVNQGGQERPS